MFITKGQDAVGQVAPGGHQFIVVPGYEFRPIPIRVMRFRHVDGQVIAQGIRVIAGQSIPAPDRPVADAGDFLAFQVHELVGRYIVGQGKRPFFFGKDLQEFSSSAHQFAGQSEV